MISSIYDDVNATNEELDELAKSNAKTQPNSNEEVKSNVLYRILAFLLAACPIVLLCLLPMRVFVLSETAYMDRTAIALFIGLFTGEYLPDGVVVEKLLGFIPMFGPLFDGKIDVIFIIHNLSFYTMALALVASAVLAIIALFSGKKAPALARAIAWLDMWAVGGVVMSYYTIAYLFGLDLTVNTLATILPLAITAGFALVGFILSAIKSPKRVWISALFFLFTVAFNVVCIYMCRYFTMDFALLVELKGGFLGGFFTYGQWVILGFSAIAMVFASATLAKRVKFGLNLVTTILHFLIVVALLVPYLLYWKDGFFAQ